VIAVLLLAIALLFNIPLLKSSKEIVINGVTIYYTHERKKFGYIEICLYEKAWYGYRYIAKPFEAHASIAIEDSIRKANDNDNIKWIL
jgi:hypothetical protein